MPEFPKIQQDEYVLMFAEKATGIIVDSNGKWYIQEPTQEVYKVVPSYEEAERFVTQKLEENDALEGCIYNWKHELVKFIN